MKKVNDFFASAMLYFLIVISVLGLVYSKDWEILAYSFVFVGGLWLLIYKTKQEIRRGE